MKAISSVTVLVDTREKIPLLFPQHLEWVPYAGMDPRTIRLYTEHKKLEAGDYTIKGHEPTVLMERKYSARELHTNLCTGDRARFIAAIEKLAESCAFPYLLLDFTPWEMYTVSEEVKKPWLVFDHLSQVVHRYGLRLLYAGGCHRAARRRILGDQVTRLMMAHCFDPQEAMDRAEIHQMLGLVPGPKE
jgi:ERCC4-type nuclease